MKGDPDTEATEFHKRMYSSSGDGKTKQQVIIRIHCVICGEDFDNQIICKDCLGKLVLEKCSSDPAKSEFYLVWKNPLDGLKYPSVITELRDASGDG